MRIHEITETVRKLYHVSDDPNLEINPKHDLAQGQLGRGFYVSCYPKAWRASLGKRPYVYLVDRSPLKIAKDAPSGADKEFIDWAVEKGYMKIGPVVRPNGDSVFELDDKTPLIRPSVTDIGQRFLWKDPMTGGGLTGLINEYLRDHGFNAYEARYSRDGHQIIIFDLSVVRLKRVQRITETLAPL
jgi:hypothetical protein